MPGSSPPVPVVAVVTASPLSSLQALKRMVGGTMNAAAANSQEWIRVFTWASSHLPPKQRKLMPEPKQGLDHVYLHWSHYCAINVKFQSSRVFTYIVTTCMEISVSGSP